MNNKFFIGSEKQNHQQLGGRLLSKGSYGCVFTPEIACVNPVANRSTRYISKIQLNDSTAKKEYEIGLKIREKIPLYNHFFNTIESYCDIDISKMKDNDKTKCPMFTDKNISGFGIGIGLQKKQQRKFINMKIPYVGKYIFMDYMTDHTKRNILNLFIDNYKHLLEALKLLSNAGIVHFDLKGDNVLMQDRTNTPIIIDFGLSMDREKLFTADGGELNDKYLRRIFFTYAPECDYWTPEIHFINYLLHENATPSLQQIQGFCDDILRHSGRYLKHFSEKQQNQYKAELYKFYKQFHKKGTRETIMILVESYKTWDLYALTIMFFDVLKFMSEYKTSMFYNKFMELFFGNMRPNVDIRNSIERNISVVERYHYLESQQDIEFLKAVKDDYTTSGKFVKMVEGNKKRVRKLTQKIDGLRKANVLV